MSRQTIDQGIASQIGHYADAIVIPAGYEQILVSGTPGIDQDGDLRPVRPGFLVELEVVAARPPQDSDQVIDAR